MKHALIAAVFLVAGCAAAKEEPKPLSSRGKTTFETRNDGASDEALESEDELPPAVDTTAGRGSTADRTPGEPAKPKAPEAPEAPAAATENEWSGTLADTSWVTYGGGQWCNYRMRITGLEVKASLAADGKVLASTVTGTVIEEVVGTCADPPHPASPQSYSHTSLDGETGLFSLTGAATNSPRADLQASFAVNGATARASLRFHRVDLGAPFDWTVTTDVDLAKR